MRVIADLADINSAGINRLQYYESYTNDIDQSDLTIVSRSDERISVVVESASKKEIPVVPKIDGQIAMDGYQAEAPIFSPETIAVTGPKSEIESIKEARVNIQRENLTKTVTAEMDFVLINTDGEEVTSDLVVLEREKVTVTIPISRIKEIPLAVSLLPGAGATDENTVWAVDPPTITVSGDPEELDSMNTIPLTTIDLASFESYFTDTYSIILPNEITNVTGVTSAEVTVSIKGLETKPLTVPLLQNVQFTNETEGYTTSLITTELEVMVRGTPEELETINEDNIRVIVDMQELGASTGVMQLPVRIRIDGDTATSCGAILDYKVTVRVTKDNGA